MTKDECLQQISDLKDEILANVDGAMGNIMDNLNDNMDTMGDDMNMLMDETDANMTEAMNGINDAMAPAIDAATQETIDERDRIEQAINDLVQECNNTNATTAEYCDPYDVKEQAQTLIDEFDMFLQNKIDMMADLAQETGTDIMETTMQDEMNGMQSAVDNALDVMNDDADQAMNDINDAVDEAITNLNMSIENKLMDFQGKIDDIEANFIERFWHSLEEIYEHIDPFARRHIVTQALLRKDEFIMGLNDLKTMLMNELQMLREMLMQELMVDREEETADINNMMDGFVNDMENMMENVNDIADQAATDGIASGANG